MVGNLALAFTAMGKRVLIFDADLGLANVDIIFGIHPKYNIGHVIKGEKELAEVIVSTPHGIDIIPASSGTTDVSELTEGQKLNLLNEFEELDSIYDVVFIDTGAGISSNVIYFNLAAEECIVIATGEPTSITDAYGIIKVMFKNGTRHFKLLVNMVKDVAEAKAVYFTLSQAADRFLNGVVLEYLGYVPYGEDMRNSVIGRRPVLEMFPNCEVSKNIRNIADQILKSPGRSKTDGNIKFFMKRLMTKGLYQGY